MNKPDTRQPSVLLPAHIALTLGGYPIISTIPVLFGVEPRLATVPFRALVLGISLLMLIRYGLPGSNRYRGWLWGPFLAFWLLYFIRIAWDTLFVTQVMTIRPWELWLQAVGMMFIPAAAVLVEVDSVIWRRAMRWTTITVIVACIAVSSASVWAIRSTGLEALRDGRFGTFVLSPIFYGHLGASVVLLVMYWALEAKPGVGGWILTALCVLLGSGALILSGSRGPLLALLAGATVLFVSMWSRRRWAWTVAALAGAALVLWWGISAIGDTLGLAILGRIEAALTGFSDTSGQLHIQMIHDAFTQFLDSPFLGSGVVERNSGEYPHNVLLESFMATGVVGGSLFCIMVWGTAKAGWRLARAGSDRAWIAMLFVQYMVFALTAGALFVSSHMWVLMAATCAAEAVTVREAVGS